MTIADTPASGTRSQRTVLARWVLGVVMACVASSGMMASAHAAASSASTQVEWGARHGTAAVHSTVWVDPPMLPSGWQLISYTWKVGTAYSTGHHYDSFGWWTLGMPVMAKVLVKTPDGRGYAQYYSFYRVIPLATAAVTVHLVRVGGAAGPGGAQPAVQSVVGDIETFNSSDHVVALDPTNSTGAVKVALPPGTFTFLGRTVGHPAFICRGNNPVSLTAGSSAWAEVDCIVP